ncbi:hypothetical protein ACF0H5_000603 [Mactra antiquata]
MGTMVIMYMFGYLTISLQLTLLVLGQDPCLDNNHRNITHLGKRYSSIQGSCPYTDNRMLTGWYYVGMDTIVTSPPPYCSCGYTWPVWLNGSLPVADDGEVHRKACVNFISECHTAYDIKIKKCGQFYVYYLTKVMNKAGYCFGLGSSTTTETPTIETESPVTTETPTIETESPVTTENPTITTEPPVTTENPTIGTESPITTENPTTEIALSTEMVTTSTPQWAFTPPDVISYHSNCKLQFHCLFAASSNAKQFRVKWLIKRYGREPLVIIKSGELNNMDSLILSENDLVKDHVFIPFQIACSISEQTNGDIFSPPSDDLFAGMQVLTPKITMYRDETAVIRIIPTVPSSNGISTINDNCNLTLTVVVPTYQQCSGISTRQCQINIPASQGSQGEIEIQASEDGQYGVSKEKTYDLILRVSNPVNSIWEKLSVPIKVKVLPENATYWRGRTCESLNDPHMFTFDGRAYEHHEGENDEYVLYRHTKYGVKIHHKLEMCNTNAMCNCGVAVQAGRDVYVVSTCNNMLEIGFKQCDDGVILVKQESDTLYTIYLPYGTYVKARIDNTPYAESVGSMIVSISIFPSVHDQHGRTEGLCGTLDNNQDNDFGQDESDRKDFINRWRVPVSESIFSSKTISTSPWQLPVCTCSVEHGQVSKSVHCIHTTDKNCTKGRRVGEKICEKAKQRPIGSSMSHTIPTLQLNTSSANHVTSTTQRTPERSTFKSTSSEIPPAYSKTTTGIPAHTVNHDSWTAAKAKEYCTRYMDRSRVYKLCSHVPYTDTDRAVETCALDVLITRTTVWQRVSRATMQESCISEIGRNKTVRDEKEQTTTPTSTSPHSPKNGTTPSSPANQPTAISDIVKELELLACPNECNDQGICKNGTCVCYKGYGGDDCFIDISKPPSSTNFIHGNRCDESNVSCTHISIYGGLFASETVSCHVTSYQTYADVEGKQDMDAYVIHGQAQSLVQVLCPLAPSRGKRSVYLQTEHVKLLSCYRVSVSNDGIHHNEPLKMCVFNSKCQTLENRADGTQITSIKDGYCFIDGQCVSQGTETTDMVCDPIRSLYHWSIPDGLLDKQTTDYPEGKLLPTKHNTLVWTVVAIVAAASVLIIGIIVVVCKRKHSANKVKTNADNNSEPYKDTKAYNNYTEEVYDYIDTADVHSQMQPHHSGTMNGEYESVLGNYMHLKESNKFKSDYDKLHQFREVLHLQPVPDLPARTNEANPSDPYAKLTQRQQNGNDYTRLRGSVVLDDDYLSPVNQAKSKEDSENNDAMETGYEIPFPQTVRKY